MPDRFSGPLRDFVHACLAKEPTHRPAPTQLLLHPWLEQRCTAPQMADWVRQAVAK